MFLLGAPQNTTEFPESFKFITGKPQSPAVGFTGGTEGPAPPARMRYTIFADMQDDDLVTMEYSQ